MLAVDIKIDYDLCNGCNECVKTCTFGVLELFEERPIVANPSKCSGCLQCKSTCPVHAITVKQK